MNLQCGHSKKMAPEWSRLAEDWKENEIGLVAKIDCTDNKAKPLCKKHKVYSFPAIYYGNPESLEMYEGGRSYEDLSLFANEILKPICNPSTLESCNDDTKILIQELNKMSYDELRGLLKTEKKALKEIAKNFKLQSKSLQHKYQQLTEEKNSKVEEIMDWGLELARYVKTYKLKVTEGTVKEEL